MSNLMNTIVNTNLNNVGKSPSKLLTRKITGGEEAILFWKQESYLLRQRRTFDNTQHDAIREALKECGVHRTAVNWIRLSLQQDR